MEPAATAVAADPAMVNLNGEEADSEELEEEAERYKILESASRIDPRDRLSSSRQAIGRSKLVFSMKVCRTVEVLTAPLRAAPTARVERRTDLANIVRELCLR
jgi:hypothetical protein